MGIGVGCHFGRKRNVFFKDDFLRAVGEERFQRVCRGCAVAVRRQRDVFKPRLIVGERFFRRRRFVCRIGAGGNGDTHLVRRPVRHPERDDGDNAGVLCGKFLRICNVFDPDARGSLLAVLTGFSGRAAKAGIALFTLLALLAFFALFAFFTLLALLALFAGRTLFALQAFEPFRFAADEAVLHGDLVGGLAVLRFAARRERHAKRRRERKNGDRLE